MNHHSVVFDVTVKTHDEIHLWAAMMDEEADQGGFTRSSGKQDYWDE